MIFFHLQLFTEVVDKTVNCSSYNNPQFGMEHATDPLYLCVYVNDFKLAGLTRNLPSACKALTVGGLVLDKPEPLGLYLGCNQRPITMSQSDADARLENIRPLYPRVGAGPLNRHCQNLTKPGL